VDLVRAIRASLEGKKRSPDATFGRAELRHQILSRREYKVMLALAAGKRPRDIAIALSLSAKTVNTYKRRLLNKMGFDSTADIVRYVIENHLE
jgi:DNA-binding NarL/FixJ family response regulator